MSEISLDNLSLRYPLYGANTRSLKRNIINFIAQKEQIEKQITHVDALKKITFSLKDGDYLGLIGSNGAGKSTLLKVLSGIYEPVQGAIKTQGTISALLNSGIGMQAELTGYENIRFASKIKNFPKKELPRIIKDIEDFTELGDFLKIPVKTYSAGMQARLAFAISTTIHPDILILDEIMGTGDAHFINKARDRMHNFLRKAKILVLASHSTDLIKQFCNKILWLEKGEIKEFGSDVDAIMSNYLSSSAKK